MKPSSARAAPGEAAEDVYKRQLQSHRAALLCRRAQLDALMATLDKTLLTEEGKCAMTDTEQFEGFKQKLVAENEALSLIHI